MSQGWMAFRKYSARVAGLLLCSALGACTPYFRQDPNARRKAGTERQATGYLERFGFERSAGGNYGIAAREGGDSIFPAGFPRAVFHSGSDQRVTFAGPTLQGSRAIDQVQFDASSATLSNTFGLFGLGTNWPSMYQTFESYRELLDIVHDSASGKFYTLASRSDGRCLITRHDANTGAWDSQFLIYLIDCTATEARRGLLVLGTSQLTAVVVGSDGAEWKVFRYELASKTRTPTFGTDLFGNPGVLQITHPTFDPASGATPATYDLAGAFLDGSGNLYIGGSGVVGGTSYQTSVVRVTPAGLIDTSFGTGGTGFVTTTCGGSCRAYEFKQIGTESVLAGVVSGSPGIFRLGQSGGAGTEALTPVSYPSGVGQLNGGAVISKLALDPITSSKVHAIGWRLESTAYKPFHIVLDRTASWVPVTTHYGGTGYRTIVSPGTVSATESEFPLDLKVVNDSGVSKVFLSTVLPSNAKNARFRTFQIDGTSSTGDTLLSPIFDTTNVHILGEKSYPIGQFVDELGRVTTVSRVVRMGSTVPWKQSPNFPELSSYVLDRFLSDGTRDVTFSPSPILLESAIGDCRGGDEGFAHDPVTHRFFLSCLGYTPGNTRSQEKSVYILAFEPDGTPASAFGGGKIHLDDSTLNPETTTLGNDGYILARDNGSGYVSFPLMTIPAGSILQGGQASGPGLAVGRTIYDGGHEYPFIRIYDATGMGMSTFGPTGNATPSATLTLHALAFTPIAPAGGGASAHGIYVGMGTMNLGSASVALLQSDGTEAWTRTYATEFPQSLTTESLAVDPATGNVLMATTDNYTPASTSGMSSALLDRHTGVPIALQNWKNQLPDGDSVNWIQRFPKLVYHPASTSFVIGFSQVKITTAFTQWLDPFASRFVITQAGQVGVTGNILSAGTLGMPSAPNPLLWELTLRPSGGLQGLFMAPSAAAGTALRSSQISGGIGL